jgi:hypothetical protein
MTARRTPPGDDRVIGRAFWRSVAVAAIAAAGYGAWRWWPRPAPAPVAPAPAASQGPAPAGPAPTTPVMPFEDVTAAWGIDFTRTNGADGRRLLPETMGGGVCVADVTGDGREDLLFADGDAWPDTPAGTPRGQGIAVFAQAAPGAPGPRFVRLANTGLERPGQLMAVAAVDLDGDGRAEILATGVDGVRLFVPDAPAGAPSHWREATADAGLAADRGWSTALAMADFDRDGDLDLLVAHYVEWSPAIDLRVNYTLTGIGRAYGPPTGFAGTDVRLWEQVAPLRFADATSSRGLAVRNPATQAPVAKALGLCVEDVDGDGDLDIAVANDTVQHFLFVNDGRGRFKEHGVASGIAFDRSGAATGAMGIDAAHHRNDGALAVAMGNFANQPTSFYVTRDGRHFDDDAILEGLAAATRRPLTFGLVFADLDADGREELVQANGHIEDRIAEVQPSQRYAQAAQVFWNTGSPEGAAWAEVPPAALGALAVPAVGRGLAWADLDRDGALDLVLAPVTGSPRVLRGTGARGRSCAVALSDPGAVGNRSSVGASVELFLTDGRTLRRRVMPWRSYLSQVPAEAWFGLGGGSVRSITVRWPDGVGERFDAPVQTGSFSRFSLGRGTGIAVTPARAVPAGGDEPSK